MEPLLEVEKKEPNAPTEGIRAFPIRSFVGQPFPSDFRWSYFFKPLTFHGGKRGDTHVLRLWRPADVVPIFLTVLLGVQHLVAAFAFILVPPFILQGMFPKTFGHYGLQSAFIIAGVTTLVQSLQFKIPRTIYQLGSGMTCVLGNSMVFAILFINLIMRIMHDDQLSVEDAYGQVLGTAAVCSFLMLALSFIPWKYVRRLFSPLVVGILIVLIGLDATATGVSFWGGGFDCVREMPGECTLNGNVRLPYGSPEYIGMGFFVLMLFLLFELCGTPFMRHNSAFFSLIPVIIVTGFATKGGRHYVTGDTIREMEAVDFLWTNTYKLGVHKTAALPLLGGFLVAYLETAAVLMATAEESGISEADSEMHIQGGLTLAALASLFSVLATGLPLMAIPQTVATTSISRVASRYTGVACALLLLVIGIFGKVLGAVLEIPIALYGGLMTPLSVIFLMTGIKILNRLQWDRRTALIAFFSVAFGCANLLAPEFVNDNIWHLGENPKEFVESMRFTIIQMMRVPYFLGGVIAIVLNIVLPENLELGFDN